MTYSMGNLMLLIQRKSDESLHSLASHSEAVQGDDKQFLLNLERIPISVLLLNKQGVIVRSNQAFQAFYGMNAHELTGANFLTLFQEYSYPDYARIFEQVQHQPYIQREGMITSNYGEVRWVKLHFNRLSLEQNKTILLTVTDLTTLRNQAEKLSREYEKLKLLADSVSDAIFIVNLQGFVEWQNQVARTLLEFEEHHIIGQSFSKIFPEIRQLTLDSSSQNGSSEAGISHVIRSEEVTIRKKSGEEKRVKIWIKHKKLGHRYIRIVTLQEQKTESEKVPDLSSMRDQFQMDVAQDLHDSIGGFLTGITLIGEQVLQQMKDQKIPLNHKVEEVINLIKEADELTNLLAKGMMHEEQIKHGLNETLRDHCQSITKLFHVNCTYCGLDTLDALDHELASQLYSIAKEAIGNAIRHGRADEIQVSVELCPDFLKLRVEDNGIGFSSQHGILNGSSVESLRESISSRHFSGGLGLQIMKRRADQMRGRFTLDRTSDDKTLATCRIPRNHLVWLPSVPTSSLMSKSF